MESGIPFGMKLSPDFNLVLISREQIFANLDFTLHPEDIFSRTSCMRAVLESNKNRSH